MCETVCVFLFYVHHDKNRKRQELVGAEGLLCWMLQPVYEGTKRLCTVALHACVCVCVSLHVIVLGEGTVHYCRFLYIIILLLRGLCAGSH